MANNAYVNKVQLADETVLMDISDTTAAAGDVAAGKVFYTAAGARSTGTSVPTTYEISKSNGVITLTGSDASTSTVSAPDMVVLSYGNSTWSDFLTAYNKNSVVYCRASSNSNPASGSQTRMAFLAYVNNATSPSSVEFQYYRSVSSHSATQQGDQVYVYTLTNAGAWNVKTREAYTKIATGVGMSSSYSNGTLTLTSTVTGSSLPTVSASDNGKVLMVSNGTWSVESLPVYDGGVSSS